MDRDGRRVTLRSRELIAGREAEDALPEAETRLRSRVEQFPAVDSRPTLDRLAAVKRAWDPTNPFDLNRNIQPG